MTGARKYSSFTLTLSDTTQVLVLSSILYTSPPSYIWITSTTTNLAVLSTITSFLASIFWDPRFTLRFLSPLSYHLPSLVV